MNSSTARTTATASAETTLIAALSTLPPPSIDSLIRAFSSTFHHHGHRLSSVLSSPVLFILALRHLHSLSLSQKFLLIARYFLSTLQLLVTFFDDHRRHLVLSRSQHQPATSSFDRHARIKTPLSCSTLLASHYRFPLRDLDAVLLLLLFCELRRHDPQALETKMSPDKWQRILLRYYSSRHVLSLSSTMKVPPSNSNYEVLTSLIDLVTNCKASIGAAAGSRGHSARREAAASVAAVVALPSVKLKRACSYCAICREEMTEGRDACELPCRHVFHWMCILPWLTRRNTCPCCRLRLPTDDVLAEIERLWDVVADAAATAGVKRGYCTD